MTTTEPVRRPPSHAGASPGAARSSDRVGAGTVALLVVGMAAFGSATPVSRLIGDAFPVWVGSALRMLLATSALVPLTILDRRRRGAPPVLASVRALTWADRARLAGISLIGTFGFTALMVAGMREAPGSVASVVMGMTPAVTAIGAVVFLGETMGWARGTALAVAVVGVVLVEFAAGADTGPGANALVGSALVFGAVCCEAAYTLLGKQLTANLAPLSITLCASTGALVAFAPLAVADFGSFDVGAVPASAWLALLWWGLGTLALGSVAWFAGMRRVEAATAAAFMAVMPVSALLLSYLLLGEPFRWVHVLGMACVLVGLALVVRSGATVH